MRSDAEKRQIIVGVDAAFRAARDVDSWGAPTAKCARCNQTAPAYNDAGRCAFCEVTGFLFRASGASIQRFIWEGVTVC